MSVTNQLSARTVFIKNPSAKTHFDSKGRYVIELPTEGILISGSSELECLFDFFSTPTKAINIHEENLKKLIHCRAIVPNDAKEVIARGTTSEARSFSKNRKTDLSELNVPYAIIGSAVDFAQVGSFSSYRGPDAIRNFIEPADTLSDLGNLTWFPSEGLIKYGKRLSYFCALIRDRNASPIILGGDHSLTYFSVSATCEYGPKVGVIQFDAHNDLGIAHEQLDLQELTHANVAGFLRQLPIQFLLQVGLRQSQIGYTDKQNDSPLYQIKDSDISSFDSILARLIQKYELDAFYISVDLDCIDPLEAPDVSTPLLGGLTFTTLNKCIKKIASTKPVVGLDIVEVSPSSELSHSAKLAAELIKSIVGVNN